MEMVMRMGREGGSERGEVEMEMENGAVVWAA